MSSRFVDRAPRLARGLEGGRSGRRLGGVAVAITCLGVGAACTGDESLGPGTALPLAELPPDLAAVELVAEGQATAPYIMLELREPTGFRGFVIVNGAGRPVWYFRTRGSPFSFTRRRNGNFVLLDSERGLVEVTPGGAIVRELAQADRPGRRIHHDVTATERNTILFIAEDWRQHAGRLINGEAIWEWWPESGELVMRWSAFDMLDPLLDRGPRSRDDDWLHANSIALGARRNILLSLHFLDQVISLRPDFGAIEWRLGGTRASIAVDDAFSGQHTARETVPGRVLIFDNGFERAENPYSRAVEYTLTSTRAVKIWEWRPPRDNWARVISGAHRMSNGNTLVTFGTPAGMPAGSTGPIEVYEVAPDGSVVWRLGVGGAVSSLYRATPLVRLE